MGAGSDGTSPLYCANRSPRLLRGIVLLPWPRRPLLIGASAVGSAALSLAAADQLAAALYGHWKPRLERSFSQQLGQSVQLGAYRGMRPWGLRLGPSAVLATADARSSLRLQGLELVLAPLDSLRQLTPSAAITVDAATVTLVPNASGRYWSLPPRPPAGEPPRLNLQLQLRQPARVSVPARGGLYALNATASVALHRRSLNLRSSLSPLMRGSSGTLQLQGSGQWQRQRWQLRLGLRNLALDDLSRLLPQRRLPQLPGRLNGNLALQLTGSTPQCQGQIQLEGFSWPQAGNRAARGLDTARLRCRGRSLTLAATGVRFDRLQARLSGRFRWRRLDALSIDALRLQRGQSWLTTRGRIDRRGAALQANMRLLARDLPDAARLPLWLQRQTIEGRLDSSGSWRQPRLSIDLAQRQSPLLGAWRARLSWTQGLLQLASLRNTHLRASGAMPLQLGGARGVRSGPLQLDLDLQRYPLQRLTPVLGAPLAGELSARGTVTGPLQQLIPRLQLQVANPTAGPLQLLETWQGDWIGQVGGGGRLVLQSQQPAPDGLLRAELNRSWLPTRVALSRGEGELTLSGSPRRYNWRAGRLLLDGIALGIGAAGPREPLLGQLSGEGDLSLQPLAFGGTVAIAKPAIPGLQLRALQLQGRYGDRRYWVRGSLQPLGRGSVGFDGQGRWQGPFTLQLEARNLERQTLQQLADLGPLWQDRGRWLGGVARDLGTLLINTLGASLQEQLEALARAHQALIAGGRGPDQGQGSFSQRLGQLQTQLDADLTLTGPSLARSSLDLTARAHLFRSSGGSDQPLSREPVTLRLQGLLLQGGGSFSVQHLPLALLSLLTPVPDSLRGGLNLTGRYGLNRRKPELRAQLSLEDAELAGTAVALQQGTVTLQNNRLSLDLALQAKGASNGIELAGVVPLDPSSEALELRLSSRGDGLSFLTALARPVVSWKGGSIDLQLLLRGSLNTPIANGFLRVRDGRLTAIRQPIEELEATLVFDFEQLLVQQLTARIGKGGSLNASGHLGLLTPTASEPALTAQLSKVAFNLPRIQAIAEGSLQISGSLRDLQMGGSVTVNNGIINAQPGGLVPAGPGSAPQAARRTVAQLLLEDWNFQDPLLLVGSEVQTNANENVQRLVPRFRALGFNNLNLRIGPDLKIVLPNVASFRTAGALRLSGRLDPSLRARGLIRLLQGRLNLFTTTFSLDPEAPNVAIFTPAGGLVPYVDIAMRTRVSDSLAVGGLASSGLPSLAEIESQGGLSSLNQLNLVRITVSVAGPADRLAQSIRLRSSPPLPEPRLLALIGGNSLAGLSGGEAGAAIATVVGQTLLSPVIGGLSDALGQRVSFGLYPTYVTPTVASTAALQSRRLAPQLVLGSEIGLDVTERFNLSVLAAPNRSDIPPQLNLNLRASDLLNVQGTVDSQGAWQTQLQLFLRF